MSEALALKYRPAEFSSVCAQSSIVKTLERQLDTNTFVNCYLFCGPSGCGKTTLARIFGKRINKGEGSIIEIDGASNNGVDNVKQLIQQARERAIDGGEYKIIIMDECHMLTNQAWNAFLKCIEEPPKYTIFLFCTTDPQKIPATILNRVMRFNLTKIPQKTILERLNYVCSKEGFINYEESIDYISKSCNGGMRDALAMLDKCAGYSRDLSIDNVLNVLGNFSYQSLFELTNAIVDNDEKKIISIVENFYNQGNDLKQFVDKYLNFINNLSFYCIFKNIDVTNIPTSMEKMKSNDDTLCLQYATGFDGSKEFFKKLAEEIQELKNTIKYDTSIEDTVIIKLLQVASRG